MSSYVRVYKECKDKDINPIVGCEMYIAQDMNDKTKRDEKHITLLAKNNEGLKNLYHLVSIANREGFYYKPRIDFEELSENSEGLVALSGCLKGVIAYHIGRKNRNKAIEKTEKYKEIFGDDFYIEIMSNKMEEQYNMNKKLANIAKRFDIPLVATNDVHYIDKSDAEAHDIMLAINSGDKLNGDERSLKFSNDEFYIKTEEEIRQGLFKNRAEYSKEIDEAVNNTLEINKKCNVELDLGGFMLPDFETPSGNTQAEYLREEVSRRLFEFAMENDIDIDKYSDRLEHELDVIEQKEFEGYFLIVNDFVEWAKEEGIIVGPGRGSAGSSLVSYLLNIIDINPIERELLFSRFMNPQRTSLADIDLDFPEGRRNEVSEYIRDKYGEENVASICTFGRMKAKGALKDVGRALGYDNKYIENKITNRIQSGQTIEETIEENKDLKTIKKNNEKLFEYAMQLEGKPRHRSTHPCAEVITPSNVEQHVPLAKNGDDIVTQTEMHDTEELGLLKMDLLGLKTLDIIEQTIDQAYEDYGKEKIEEMIGFQIEKGNWRQIPKDDKKVFKNIYQDVDTSGVFQVESYLFEDLLKKMQPSKFEHIIALVSLGRPGPIEAGLVDSYIDRMHGEEEIEYPHESVKEPLEETYGLPIYQEQVMELGKRIAGYSLGEADILRRAMGKKKDELMQKQREKFMKGTKNNGHSKQFAEKMFNKIEKFSGYGFNKCVSKDTVIERASGNQYSPAKLTIEEFYEIWNSKTSTGKKYRGKRGVKILSFDSDGRVRPRKVKNVYKTGVKPVYKITLSDGSNIKATKDHKFFTEEGKWKKLEELSGKYLLLVKGDYEDTQSQDYPVKPTKIENIEYVGEEQTYDLEMESTSKMGHNYIANDIVTHNSHATAYAAISYMTAYLKNYFPEHFYGAIMKYEILASPKDSEFSDYLAECYEKGIEVITPDINESSLDFRTIDGKVQYGLRSVKGVGKKAAKHIIENRPYNSIDDFISKTSSSKISKTVVEGLTKAGAFDNINDNRKMVMDYYKFVNNNKDSSSQGMFGPEQIVGNPEVNEEQIVEWEMEVLRASITYPTEWDEKRDGDKVRLKGIINEYNETTDRNNNLMAFAELETKYREITLVIFASVYGKKRHIIERNNVIKVQGEKSGDSLLVKDTKIRELDKDEKLFEEE